MSDLIEQAGVPVAETTAPDFIMVRAALVRRLGGANEALVWTRIDYRVNAKTPPYVDLTGTAWWPATRDDLADETGLSPDQAKRAVQSLVDAGFIEATEHRLGGNYDRTKSYRTVVIGRPLDWAESPNESGRNRPMDWAESPNVPLSQTYRNTEDSGARAKPKKASAHHLPADWRPTDEHRAFAAERGVDVDLEADSFRAHAEANDRRAVVWNAAFRQWLIKARPTSAPAGGRGGQSLTEKWGAGNEWMEYNR